MPASGRIYTFGLADTGQLGTGASTNCLSPSTVLGPFVHVKGKTLTLPVSLENQPLYVVKHLYCGSDQCFASVFSPQVGILPL